MTTHLSNHPFRHRSNPDGSWDSICMRCHLTATTSHDEQSLGSRELEHLCETANIGVPTHSLMSRIDQISNSPLCDSQV
jgi:hypothetical protein